ncbi:hypothetical protein FQN55_002655 [Onygenales sp. PD_40]|nr:hypothetical protein FQN55_002655 [Onygenales sp. PD_40]KAK2780047.1 hypothetical protein FQN52_002272 [Onygenales sp. PD_12]KAK2800918.1 hypothetical protein FQN51_005853 [Onygenales sp. PD_10]
MASTIPLKTAIYENPGIKHWSLFIDAKEETHKTIIHLLGARQRYFLDVRTPSDARISNSLIELHPLCEIDATKIDDIRNIAWDTPVRNDKSDYSCQDFILEILERLEEEHIIAAEDGDYQRNKSALAAKRESWQ